MSEQAEKPLHPAQAPTAPQQDRFVPPKLLDTEYELIDTDPHIARVYRYARPIDWLVGGGAAAFCPLSFWAFEKFQPAGLDRKAFIRYMRLNGIIGILGGAVITYIRSSYRFYGINENKREVEMDMREMVNKVKKGEPLYGVSRLSPYMQGVAARNSRYNAVFSDVLWWPNFVNHSQHGVDTAKYYQQAERELEAERLAKGGK